MATPTTIITFPSPIPMPSFTKQQTNFRHDRTGPYLHKVMVYVCVLTGNSFVVSTSPLLMEFGVEKLYPISEGMIGGWLNIWYNLITVVFLGLFNIPGMGTAWLSYVLPVSCFAVIPVLLTVSEEYNRRQLDEPLAEDGDTADIQT